MERLNYPAAAAWLEQHQSRVELELQQEPDKQQAALTVAKARAKRLAIQLAPLFPIVAAQTKSEPGREAWVDSWARQILGAGLSDQELVHGLKTVAQVLIAHGSPPLAFSHFLEACRPGGGVGGWDADSRRVASQAMPKLRQDLLKNKEWCCQRDLALTKLRKMGY